MDITWNSRGVEAVICEEPETGIMPNDKHKFPIGLRLDHVPNQARRHDVMLYIEYLSLEDITLLSLSQVPRLESVREGGRILYTPSAGVTHGCLEDQSSRWVVISDRCSPWRLPTSLTLPRIRAVDNERLEFLGDAVIELAYTDYLSYYLNDQRAGECRPGRCSGEPSLARAHSGTWRSYSAYATRMSGGRHRDFAGDAFRLVGACAWNWMGCSGDVISHLGSLKLPVTTDHKDLTKLLQASSNRHRPTTYWRVRTGSRQDLCG